MDLLRKVFLNEWIIIGVILANSITLFLMGFEGLSKVEWLSAVDHLFTVFFLLEAVIKIGTLGWRAYNSDAWNRFDFILVAISLPSLFELFITIPDISFLLVFRLLRVLRILRFMRFIPNITSLIAGVRRAIKASVFVFFVLFIYNVLLAVLSSYLFGNVAPEFFGDPLISLYSIFQIFTLEGWNEIPATVVANAEPGSWMPGFARTFFLLVVLTGGIFGFSILNAIFVDEMVMDNNDNLEAKVDELNAKIDRLINDRGGNAG